MMQQEVTSKAVRYILGVPDWRPKLRLAQLVGMVDFGVFSSFRKELIQLQDSSGLLPLFWTAGNGVSLRYSAMAIDLLHDSKDKIAAKSAIATSHALAGLQSIDGSWSENSEALDKLKRRHMHPGWSKDLERAEVTSSIIASLGLTSPSPVEDPAYLKGREWLHRFLKEQDYETRRAGDEYSLNPWTLDLVAASLLDSGVESSKPSINDAVTVLSRNLSRALRRTAEHGTWSLLAGTRTLMKVGGHKELLNQVVEELSDTQQRDGSWRQGRVTNGVDLGEWTLQTLRFLTSIEPSIRQHCKKTVAESLGLRDFVAASLQKNEETTRQIFLTRFAEVGVKPNQPPEHLLLASFLYSILEQFYWVTSEFDPQSEYLKLILQIGRLERVGLQAYTDSNSVRRALFRSQALRDQASTRKGEVAHSISLFATFLETRRNDSFHKFTLALRKFILLNAPTLALGWKRAELLGELLRLEVQEKDDPSLLVASLESSMKCLPGVGEKVYALFLYYVGHILKIWEDIPLDLLEVPTDWNLVKPYAMLQFTSTPLAQLKERPQLAADSIQQAARELFKDDPGKLYGLWVVGNEWCARPWMCRDKAGRYCWLYAQCPYPKSRK